VNWRARAENIRARQSCVLTKPPKPPFVSFGSTSDATCAEKTVARTVVKYRLRGGCPRSWCAAIGTRSRDEIIVDLRERFGDRLIEVLP